MNKRKKPPALNTETGKEPGRKDLPSLMFEEYATNILQALFLGSPLAVTHDDLIQEIRAYLDHSTKEIRLRGKVRMKVKAIDLPKYFNPPHTGENFEILDQADFKGAEPLYTDKNLTTLDEPMQRLRTKAGELSIGWDAAVSIVRRVADKFGPDVRPPGVQRGEFGELVIRELTRIRDDKHKFQAFDELENIYPAFEVVRLLRNKPFDDEDREILIRPNRWGRLTNYAAGILERHFKKKPETIKKDRKQFRAWARDYAPEKLQ